MPRRTKAKVRRWQTADLFPTPDDLAQRMAESIEVRTLPPGARILEPSAGLGTLVRAVEHIRSDLEIDAIELDADQVAELQAQGYRVRHKDFLDFAPVEPFDAVLMNPPFGGKKKGLPAMPSYHEHIWHAWSMLVPGGWLAAIAPVGFCYGRSKKDKAFRAWVEEHALVEELSEDTFAEVGTQVRSAFLLAQKPPSREWRRQPFGCWPSWYAHRVAQYALVEPHCWWDWEYCSGQPTHLNVRELLLRATARYRATWLLDELSPVDWQRLTSVFTTGM
jgi:hypothetical protein